MQTARIEIEIEFKIIPATTGNFHFARDEQLQQNEFFASNSFRMRARNRKYRPKSNVGWTLGKSRGYISPGKIPFVTLNQQAAG
jgi:hypothetical protein